MAWKTGRISRAVMLVTFVATLVVPLQFAVLFGMALSIVLQVFRQSNKVVVTQWVLQPEGFPLEQPPPAQLPSHQLTLLHVYGSLFFAAAKSMEEMLPQVGDATHAVVAINLRGKSEIGSTFVTVLQRYSEALRQHDSKLMLVGVDPVVRDQLAKTGVLKVLGEENVFVATPQLGAALNQAVAAANAWLDKSRRRRSLARSATMSDQQASEVQPLRRSRDRREPLCLAAHAARGRAHDDGLHAHGRLADRFRLRDLPVLHNFTDAESPAPAFRTPRGTWGWR